MCEHIPAGLLVLVAGMVAAPGESAAEMFAATGYEQPTGGGEWDAEDDVAVFYHDVAPDLAAEALTHGWAQAEAPWGEPWPLDAWPDVPTRYLMCQDDRLFPAQWTRRVVRERLGIAPDELVGGHCPALSRPRELADRLEAYRPRR